MRDLTPAAGPPPPTPADLRDLTPTPLERTPRTPNIRAYQLADPSHRQGRWAVKFEALQF